MAIKELTEKIEHSASDYEVSSQTYEILESKTLIPLLGPFAVGKTTIMKSVVDQDPSFTRVRSFTTREKRHNEDENTYVFLDHNEENLRRIIAQIGTRALVQFMVHPTTKNIYGSTIDSYGPQEYALLDIVPKALPALENLPFREIKLVEVVVPPEEWSKRMEQRLRHSDPGDIQNRLQEGVHNLEWAFERDDQIAWLNNGDRPVTDAAQDFIGIAKGNYTDTKSAKKIGYSLLQKIRELRDS